MRSAVSAEPPTGSDFALNRGQLRRLAQIHRAVFVFYAIDAVFLTVLGWIGSVPLAFGLVYAVAGWCMAGFCVLAFRRGRMGWRELDLNNAAMSICAAAQMLFTAWLAPSVGGLMLMSLMTVLALSALQLSTRALLATWLAFAVGTAATVLSSAETLGLPMSTPAQRLLSAVWFAWLIGKCALINVEGARLRQQASDANAGLQKALDELAKVATTDELTVIANRRSIVADLHAALEAEHDRSGSIAVALFDIDHFKHVNDRFGHAGGDTVLREFAALVSRNLRPDDRIGRYGGEEFLLVLKRVRTAPKARETADRMRRAIESFDWGRVMPGLRITASVGVALVDATESAGSAIERADRALYDAKAEGRNRVVLAECAAIPFAAEP